MIFKFLTIRLSERYEQLFWTDSRGLSEETLRKPLELPLALKNRVDMANAQQRLDV